MARRVNRRLRELAEPPAHRGARYIPGEEDEGPILTQLGFLMVSVLVFVLVTAAAAWFGANQIQDSLEADAALQLANAGFDGIVVSADGRDIELVGTVGDESAIEEVTMLAETVPGVRSVMASLSIDVVEVAEGPVAAAPLALTWVDGALVVSGTISTDEVRNRIVSRLEAAFPAGVDASELVTRQGVALEDDWLPAVLEVIDNIAGMIDDGQIVVNGDAGVVTVSAELPTRQERGDVRQDVEEMLAAAPLDFVSGFTVEDAPPPPPREEVIELQEDLDDLIAGKIVEFALNSDRLTLRGEGLLDEVLEALRLFPDVPVEIAGHADAQGTDEHNLDLSRRRAESVLAYLVEHGENPARFEVIGYGSARPVADNTTEAGRARNRRIEFIALDD